MCSHSIEYGADVLMDEVASKSENCCGAIQNEMRKYAFFV